MNPAPKPGLGVIRALAAFAERATGQFWNIRLPGPEFQSTLPMCQASGPPWVPRGAWRLSAGDGMASPGVVQYLGWALGDARLSPVIPRVTHLGGHGVPGGPQLQFHDQRDPEGGGRHRDGGGSGPCAWSSVASAAF